MMLPQWMSLRTTPTASSMPRTRRPACRNSYNTCCRRGRREARRRAVAPRSLLLGVLLQPGLAGQHRARDLDHRHRAVLARALEDAICLLLRRPRAAHQDPLRAFDRLAVLERAAGRRGV